MMGRYSGGCACRAIRYYIFDEPLTMNDCHCRDCQRMSGTGHSSYLTFANRARVKLEGQAQQFVMRTESGHTKTRSFCPQCGSPLYMTFSAMPHLFAVHAASLDDPSRYEPAFVTYAASKQSWDSISDTLTCFAKMPPQPARTVALATHLKEELLGCADESFEARAQTP